MRARSLSFAFTHFGYSVGAVSVAAAAAAAAAAALQLGGGSAVRANELDKDDESEEQPHHHRQDSAQAARRDDADDDDDAEPSSSSSSSDDDDDDSQDETAELMRELARIKAEREAERLRLEHEKLERDARDNEAAVLRSNPLMNNDRPGAAASASSDSVLKRKWFDETVFKNQAKVDDPKKPKRFINDTIRSDFHIRFLDRYIK